MSKLNHVDSTFAIRIITVEIKETNQGNQVLRIKDEAQQTEAQTFQEAPLWWQGLSR